MLKRFLLRGDQAKVTMVYRGRELAHAELGRRILDRLVENLKPLSKVERTPMLDGRFLTMVFGPDRDKIRRLAKSGKSQKSAGTAPAASRSESERSSGRKEAASSATTASPSSATQSSAAQPPREK